MVAPSTKRNVAKKLHDMQMKQAEDAKVAMETQVKTVLQQAHEIIYGEREQAYGHPSKNLSVIADFWTVHLAAKYGFESQLTIEDVCGMMVLMKQARLINTPDHKDSLVDTCGYAALQARCQEAKQ